MISTRRIVFPMLLLGAFTLIGCGSKDTTTEAAPGGSGSSATSGTAGSQGAPPMSADAQAQMRAAQQNSAALRAPQAGK